MGVPVRMVEQALEAVWSHFSSQFGQVPSIFAFGCTHQSSQVVHGSLMWLGPFKMKG
jgi:hypothetical protein